MSDMTDSQLNKAILNAKTDLDSGVAATVPTGQEGMPPGKTDPMALRKAMFKIADAKRAQEAGVSVDPVAQQQIDAMHGRELNPEGQMQNVRQQQRQQDVQQPVTPQVQVADPNELVPLQLGNATIKVKRADIERAGGEELYVRRRALDEEQLQLSRERQQMAAARQELEDRLAASQQRSNRSGVDPVPGQGNDPANLGADPASTVNPGVRGADIETMSQEIADQLYSGDAESAAKAVKRVLLMAASRGESLSMADIDARVQQAVKAATQPQTTQPRQEAINPVVETVNAQINEMARSEFGELLKDEVARTAAFAQFQKWVRLPENADRRAVDVARDACQWAEDTLRNPRAKVIEQKRGLQPTNAGTLVGGMVDAEPDAQTAAEAVATLAAARRFGRRVPNA